MVLTAVSVLLAVTEVAETKNNVRNFLFEIKTTSVSYESQLWLVGAGGV